MVQGVPLGDSRGRRWDSRNEGYDRPNGLRMPAHRRVACWCGTGALVNGSWDVSHGEPLKGTGRGRLTSGHGPSETNERCYGTNVARWWSEERRAGSAIGAAGTKAILLIGSNHRR